MQTTVSAPINMLTEFSKYNMPEPEDLSSIQWQRLNLLWKYNLEKIDVPIALFKSEEILPAFKKADAPYNHWEKFTDKNFKHYIVPGNHETMFQMPHVKILAKLLEGCLAETEFTSQETKRNNKSSLGNSIINISYHNTTDALVALD